MTVIQDRGLLEADPGEQSFHKTGTLRQTLQGIHCRTRQQTEIARVTRDGYLRHIFQHAVESSGGDAFQPAFTLACAPRGVNHVVTLTPFRNQIGNEFRRILQICIYRDDGLAARMIYACGKRNFFAKVARKINHFHTRISVV